MKTHHRRLNGQTLARHERGVVLLFALIALLILMIGAVALVRSFSTSGLNTGSIAFKKDLVNRHEVAVARVLAMARANNSLADEAVAASPRRTMNYSPVLLNYNDQGIPLVLLMSNADFNTAIGDPAVTDIDMGDGIRLRYVIDRQCNQSGVASALPAGSCVTGSTSVRGGSSDVPIRAEFATRGGRGALTVSPVYRLTIRAIGPRNTLAFYQTTFTL